VERSNINLGKHETSLAVTSRTLLVLFCGYYFWFVVYILLGIASIALPGAAAVLVIDTAELKLFAGLGAVAAALFTFLRPHEQAAAYDAAIIIAWKAKVQARMGLLSEKDAASELEKAIDKTALKYGNLPHGTPN
jgi:hypothetical protein